MQSDSQAETSIAYVIDDDAGLRDGISNLLRSVDISVETFGSTGEFLRSKRADIPDCLILGVRFLGISGLEFQAEPSKLGVHLPVVFITAHADILDLSPLKWSSLKYYFRMEDTVDGKEAAYG